MKLTEIYRKYDIPFAKPRFIVRFILVSDILVHSVIFYGLMYFILRTIDIKTYCKARYPLSTATQICDDEYFCGYRGALKFVFAA